jgi:hypothetical protein
MRKDQAGIWNEPQEYGPEIRSLDAIVINAHEEMEWYQRVIMRKDHRKTIAHQARTSQQGHGSDSLKGISLIPQQ